VPAQGTDIERSVRVFLVEVQAGDIVDIYDAGWRGEAELDERDEALPSSEDLRLVTVGLQNAERFVKRTWSLVVKTRRVHPDPP
jgi:hypothetical protein